MNITFPDAAREVTGSCFPVDAGAIPFLLDCGMVHGGSLPTSRAADLHCAWRARHRAEICGTTARRSWLAGDDTGARSAAGTPRQRRGRVDLIGPGYATTLAQAIDSESTCWLGRAADIGFEYHAADFVAAGTLERCIAGSSSSPDTVFREY